MARSFLFITILLVSASTNVYSAKQQIRLSDSYLPVAMQIIAHLTDQMTYEVQADEPAKPTKPPAKPAGSPSKPAGSPSKPAGSPSKPAGFPSKPAGTPIKPFGTPTKPPSSKPTTARPSYVISSPFESGYQQNGDGWFMSYSTAVRFESTTPFHRPGLYAPVAPPRPGERVVPKDHVFLLPISHNSQYTVIEPLDRPTEEPFLSIENTEIKPLVEPKPDGEPLLPPHFESRTSEDLFLDDELSDENLQYLSPNVRDMIKMANDPDDEGFMEDLKAGNIKAGGKGKLSSSNLRLQLLYDLLSREAKKQKLNDFSGFSDTVMRELAESSSGGARAQLSFVLSKMVDRRDCDHEYANNRAREIVQELGKDESKISAEIRYLQPLVYRL